MFFPVFHILKLGSSFSGGLAAPVRVTEPSEPPAFTDSWPDEVPEKLLDSVAIEFLMVRSSRRKKSREDLFYCQIREEKFGSEPKTGKKNSPEIMLCFYDIYLRIREVERDSRKKWSRIVNIKYRGGLYVGHCQGGLPEGKGRLSDGDGNIYDGMWRYGKKSGLGTLYFRNGDIFRGSWRDDAMHGKGKANGEGRFYSTNGDVIFGHFKDGWRHGNFLCMKINGTRCLEVWDEGVLVSRKQLDSDARAG
ncbi:hypothetical protein RJ640_009885 [Escallonia rubra]|uniref:Uncharacterized protein n=1 Tax=Escallonia rubra TaxID=112253 RepID=A0AA88S1U6_9ASTE|nr:hypothetical protein RJ640_009885 [Escallonia rubra]